MIVKNGTLQKIPQVEDASTALNSDCEFRGFYCTAFHCNTDLTLYLKGAGKIRSKVCCIEGATYYIPNAGISTNMAGTTKPDAGDVTVFFYDFN